MAAKCGIGYDQTSLHLGAFQKGGALSWRTIHTYPVTETQCSIIWPCLVHLYLLIIFLFYKCSISLRLLQGEDGPIVDTGIFITFQLFLLLSATFNISPHHHNS